MKHILECSHRYKHIYKKKLTNPYIVGRNYLKIKNKTKKSIVPEQYSSQWEKVGEGPTYYNVFFSLKE